MTIDMQPKVNILLSTYNGARFISEQLDSLYEQTYPNIAVHIRDDGSTDNTLELISSHPICSRVVSVTSGSNIGVAPSFLELLANNGSVGELYAFCDQDDVWKLDKISRAVDRIANQPDPKKVLYCTRLEYVDEHLEFLGLSLLPRLVGFRNAVVENIATGCTVVFGDTIRQLMMRANPADMMMHDWWAYLVASAFGTVVYDELHSIQYRQHGGTVTSWEPGLVKIGTRARGLVARLRLHEHKGLESLNQAIRFLDTYPDTSNKDKAIVELLVALRERGMLWKRICYVVNSEVVRSNGIENWSLKPMILLGWH